LLQSKDAETPGYGLYSYLLFSRRSRDRNSATYERYINALMAYLDIEEIESVRRYTPDSHINITYLPVVGKPDDIPGLLEAYDYARAQRILALLGVSHGDGPILLSARAPLTSARSIPGEYIFQDLSTAPPRVVSLWVGHFIRQARQERFWERLRKDEFVLQLRNYVAAGGAKLEDMQSAVATLIWQLGAAPR
jgi:hypothetical protein